MKAVTLRLPPQVHCRTLSLNGTVLRKCKDRHRSLFVVSDVIAEEALPESVRSDPAAWAACYGGAIPEDEYRGAIESAGFRTLEVLQRSEPYEKGGVMVRSLTVRGYREPRPHSIHP
jgi:hypothetical protein